MSDPRTEEIRTRLAAATPGPWHAWDRGIGWEVHEGDGCAQRMCMEINSEFRETFRAGDAALIANAPADLAYLLGRIEALEGKNAALEAVVDAARKLVTRIEAEGGHGYAVHELTTATRAALAALDGGEGE